ncbi:FAD-dependent tricarballylate dehydrogenase TcuA [Caryophanon tenue]|uniref:Tricarballylate dehydrogenase n=1 Tax=Caryophanon tenue TaxID=33978 RepID=A0A1C0YD00_9BACL|nr:FAD-dependent tricarballylate dehydrogenase TcuA [Caryophanon tenue]OCS85057.1 tricarballylate dehydrogenase [Caryophanon tenue]
MKYDVVVVGAGNAALCAAISAKEQGASVVVLEKGPKEKSGGNSFFTDGAIRVGYSNLENLRKVVSLTEQQAAKIDMPQYEAQDFYNDILTVSKQQSNPALVRTLTEQSFATIEWMHAYGVEFELNYDNQSFEIEDKIQFWGGLPLKTVEKGIGLMRSLVKRCDELGIEIFYQTAAKQLVKSEERITGVVIEQPTGTQTIDCQAVVLACGSFEGNRKEREQFIGEEWGEAIVRGTEFNTGDGISMALEVGAIRAGQLNGCHAIGTDANVPKVGNFEKPGDIYKKHSYPYSIMLNQNGERFVDEGADFRNFTYAKYGKEILKQPNHIAYQLYDAKVRPILRKEYDLEEATVVEAPTLEALASKLHVNKAQFLQTIADYNAAVGDQPFNPSVKDGKATTGITPPKSNWAQTIDEGPFYAFPVTCGITFAFSGIKANDNGEVLNAQHEPITGLYAAGEMIGEIFYENYPGGSGLMSGAVFGRIAGKSAAQRLATV